MKKVFCGAAVLATFMSASAFATAAIRIDPERPFGTIDFNEWRLAEYLSGSQKDAARVLFIQDLTDDQKADLRKRCEAIMAEPARFGPEVLEVCNLGMGVLNQHN